MFEPWRGTFYPKGLRQADELAYAARHLSTIEINSTYYTSQKPETFAKWATQTPDGFKFAVKASRFCTNRRVLADAGPAIDKFLGQGLAELGDRLGPILWQFMATKKFDPADIAGFLDLLPDRLDVLPLRHCLDVRHPSFVDPVFFDLCRKRGIAVCCSDSPDFPLIEAVTADFVYARLMAGEDDRPEGYNGNDLEAWAARLHQLAHADDVAKGRDIFCFFIKGGKVRAPAAAMSMQARLDA